MKSVLLVDDDHSVLMSVGVRLKSMGYAVFTAKDAVSAVSVARKNCPDVVVLDISIPCGNGFLVAQRLQNLVAYAATPIIFMSASEDPRLPKQCQQAGGIAFLKKPFEATTLADAIETALSPGNDWRPRASGE